MAKLNIETGFWIAIAISYTSLMLALTTIWQLAIIPPAIGGMFVKKRAAMAWWAGFAGVILAWGTLLLVSIVTQPAMTVADLLMTIIAGASGLGSVALVLTLAIGGCIGGLGGVAGFAIGKLVLPVKNEQSARTE